jgi:hypothetical protein
MIKVDSDEFWNGFSQLDLPLLELELLKDFFKKAWDYDFTARLKASEAL